MNLEDEFLKLHEGQEKIFRLMDEKQNQASRTNVVYNKKDLAKMFKVTERTIDNWKEQGKLDFVQIGSKTYVTSLQLEDFLKQNEVSSLNMRRRKIS